MHRQWSRWFLAAMLLLAFSAAGCSSCGPYGGGGGYAPQGFADHN